MSDRISEARQQAPDIPGGDPKSRWVAGPLADLALGCGGVYAAILVAILLAPAAMTTVAPIGLLPLLVLVTGTPHYGATLLRVYARREDRLRYRTVAVWMTVLVTLWFGVGVYYSLVGSWLITLYLTWSPWHYTRQNYGIALLVLGRRGVRIDADTKRYLHASFVLSYALTFLSIHGGAAPSSYIEVNSYAFLRLGIPEAVSELALPLLLALYALSSAFVLLRLRAHTRLSEIAPFIAIMALQGTWFCLPVLLRLNLIPGISLPRDMQIYNLMWIGIGHAVQYLWVTTYFARRTQRNTGFASHIGSSLLAGGAAWGIPAFVFMPDLLGVRAFDDGLAILVAASVNVHHFILDGAIWKLRDDRIGNVLVRNRFAPTGVARVGRTLAMQLTTAIVVLGGVGYATATVVGTWEAEFGIRRAQAREDLPRMRTAVERLRWIGRDNPAVRFDLGMSELEAGDLDEAERQFERSAELAPQDHPGWMGLGMVAEQREQEEQALELYAFVLELTPDHIGALTRTARLQERSGRIASALDAIRRASEADPGNEALHSWRRRLEQAPNRESG